jgi:arylsulfatase A-like enzyme
MIFRSFSTLHGFRSNLRLHLLHRIATLLLAVATLVLSIGPSKTVFCAEKRSVPNIILILADDQGYGDLGCHGNKILKTPALDRLHGQSIRLTNFHVDPTCSPTRAALLTGRYSCRTGVWHTIMGRSLLRRDEVTMGDVFAAAGYRTAIFGKWHQGDNYPYRALDRGFAETLVHGGGGIGQAPDYWGNTYFSPVLLRNGTYEKSEGYCTDVFFTAAIKFLEDNRRRPFLLYLPTNVPHAPYQVADKDYRPYVDAGVPEATARFYGMITNLDQNVGRLLKRLDELELAENTMVMFMTDNGSSGGGFNSEMRGRKGSEYDGGHRVPLFIRWPAQLKANRDIRRLTAHIDILPTLLDLCDVRPPKAVAFDGMSLRSLLVTKGEAWPNRTLFVQSHRIEDPQPWRKSAVMTDRYRLVNGEELYDVQADPGQNKNIAQDDVETVAILRQQYKQWYADVSTRFGEYSEIVLGSDKENPTTLCCHDWHGPEVPWDQSHIARRMPANGYWAVDVERAGRYEFTLRERPAVARQPIPAGIARLKIGDVESTKAFAAGMAGIKFAADLAPGKTRLQTWLAEQGGGGVRGAYYVDVKYLGPAAGK